MLACGFLSIMDIDLCKYSNTTGHVMVLGSGPGARAHLWKKRNPFSSESIRSASTHPIGISPVDYKLRSNTVSTRWMLFLSSCRRCIAAVLVAASSVGGFDVLHRRPRQPCSAGEEALRVEAV